MDDDNEVDGFTLLRVSDDIALQLGTTGVAFARIATLKVSAEAWRRIAGRVADRMGRPIQTKVVDGFVGARLLDWPRNQSEEDAQE